MPPPSRLHCITAHVFQQHTTSILWQNVQSADSLSSCTLLTCCHTLLRTSEREDDGQCGGLMRICSQPLLCPLFILERKEGGQGGGDPGRRRRPQGHHRRHGAPFQFFVLILSAQHPIMTCYLHARCSGRRLGREYNHAHHRMQEEAEVLHGVSSYWLGMCCRNDRCGFSISDSSAVCAPANVQRGVPGECLQFSTVVTLIIYSACMRVCDPHRCISHILTLYFVSLQPKRPR